MISAIVSVNDVLYRNSLEKFISVMFANKFNKAIVFSHKLNAISVSAADIIFLEFCNGETMICTPELMFRKKSIVIGIVDDLSRVATVSSGCFPDVVFIERKSDLETIERVVTRQWKIRFLSGKDPLCFSCYKCKPASMTHKETMIMSKILQGISVAQIANDLNLDCKTIYVHKHSVMKKFNLINDCELIAFLNSLKNKNVKPNLFRELIEHNNKPNLLY